MELFVTFAKFSDHYCFLVAMQIFVTLAIFVVFADFAKAFLAFFHTKIIILLNLLFLLFLPYSLLSLLIQQENFLVLLCYLRNYASNFLLKIW